eukprot:CAMPEP_0117615332 /NCGR_PEP_ID=MMETSP0784-20121206/84487_1 /TAXON_ID=39447 /ORGANISM="" /LENGTH=290 /DNA_ID=CAMNT_0005419069 /DNA_START=52 /DNA_END=924 /DNA_ORIENTATION=+
MTNIWYARVELLHAVPFPRGELDQELVAELLVAPCEDESGPEVVMLVEFDATPLVLDRIGGILLPVGLPQVRVHHVEDPVSLEDLDRSLVHHLDVRHVVLIETFDSGHVLVLEMQQPLASSFEGEAVQTWHGATSDVDGLATSRALAREPPVQQLLLAHIGAFQEIFILQVRDRELVALLQGDACAQHERVVVAICPAARWVTRVCTHGDPVVKHEPVLFAVPEGVVPPSRNHPLQAAWLNGEFLEVRQVFRVLLDALQYSDHVLPCFLVGVRHELVHDHVEPHPVQLQL